MAMNGQGLNDFFNHETWRYPIARQVPKRSMVCNGEMIRKASRVMCLLKACRKHAGIDQIRTELENGSSTVSQAYQAWSRTAPLNALEEI